MKFSFILVLSSILLMSCASKQERKEIEVKAAESTVTNSDALGESVQQALTSSNNLTPEQKLELEKIFAGNKKKAEDMAKESYKYRSVLISELLGENLDHKKIKIIKNNIKKIEKERLANTFETIERISEVVSGSPDKQNFSQSLIYFDRGNR